MEEVVVEGRVNFLSAERIAREIASRMGEAVLLAYYDGETGKKFPDVDCCGERSWEVYAKSRGGNLKVIVGKFEFVFKVEPRG